MKILQQPRQRILGVPQVERRGLHLGDGRADFGGQSLIPNLVQFSREGRRHG